LYNILIKQSHEEVKHLFQVLQFEANVCNLQAPLAEIEEVPIVAQDVLEEEVGN